MGENRQQESWRRVREDVCGIGVCRLHLCGLQGYHSCLLDTYEVRVSLAEEHQDHAIINVPDHAGECACR